LTRIDDVLHPRRRVGLKVKFKGKSMKTRGKRNKYKWQRPYGRKHRNRNLEVGHQLTGPVNRMVGRK
jgi:hypothetical protein